PTKNYVDNRIRDMHAPGDLSSPETRRQGEEYARSELRIGYANQALKQLGFMDVEGARATLAMAARYPERAGDTTFSGVKDRRVPWTELLLKLDTLPLAEVTAFQDGLEPLKNGGDGAYSGVEIDTIAVQLALGDASGAISATRRLFPKGDWAWHQIANDSF